MARPGCYGLAVAPVLDPTCEGGGVRFPSATRRNMVYGDAKSVLERMIEAIRDLGDSSGESSHSTTTKVKEAVA